MSIPALIAQWRANAEKDDGTQLVPLSQIQHQCADDLAALWAEFEQRYENADCVNCGLSLIEVQEVRAERDRLAALWAQQNHAGCHDLVCNGDKDYPRGAHGVGCSCRGREERADALWAQRAQVEQRILKACETAIHWVALAAADFPDRHPRAIENAKLDLQEIRDAAQAYAAVLRAQTPEEPTKEEKATRVVGQ